MLKRLQNPLDATNGLPIHAVTTLPRRVDDALELANSLPAVHLDRESSANKEGASTFRPCWRPPIIWRHSRPIRKVAI